MSHDLTETTVEILGRPYQMKCPAPEVNTLQRAAKHLEEQMRILRETSKMLSSDRIIVAAALNIAHQLLSLENQTLQQQNILQAIYEKLENVARV